jgi:hypothetical protein
MKLCVWLVFTAPGMTQLRICARLGVTVHLVRHGPPAVQVGIHVRRVAHTLFCVVSVCTVVRGAPRRRHARRASIVLWGVFSSSYVQTQRIAQSVYRRRSHALRVLHVEVASPHPCRVEKDTTAWSETM